jgi:hypothetical protein
MMRRAKLERMQLLGMRMGTAQRMGMGKRMKTRTARV